MPPVQLCKFRTFAIKFQFMLQIGFIKDNKDEVIRRLAVKNFKAEEILGQIILLDDKRRETQKKLDDGLAEANLAAKEIGGLFQKGLTAEANALKAENCRFKSAHT